MTLARRGVFASLAGLLSSCSPANLLNATVSRQGFARDADIPYGSDARQKLDLYRPDKPNGKVVLFLYGGSWDSGSKGDYLFVAQALASAGYTVVIPDYRLYPAVRFPAFVEDGAGAARWSAGRFGADKLFLMGHSAGAHIALLLAANTRYLEMAGVDRLKLGGAIGLAGPYDFLPLKSAKLIAIFGGADNPDIEAITFAYAPLPPILLIHGTADTIVYPRNSTNLAAAWRAAGAPAELKLYPAVGHIDIIAAMSGLLSGRAPTRADVLSWLDAH